MGSVYNKADRNTDVASTGVCSQGCHQSQSTCEIEASQNVWFGDKQENDTLKLALTSWRSPHDTGEGLHVESGMCNTYPTDRMAGEEPS